MRTRRLRPAVTAQMSGDREDGIRTASMLLERLRDTERGILD
jgi:hypothetical protein